MSELMVVAAPHDDVLWLSLAGELAGADLQRVITYVAGRAPEFGALMLDLSRTIPSPAADVHAIAQHWLEQLPRRPCAAVCDGFELDYFVTRLGLLLASSREHPTPLVVFAADERGAAMRWACEYAAAFRQEERRLARTSANDPRIA